MAAPSSTQALTLGGLLREIAQTLAEAGLEQSRQEARWLIARLLGISEAMLLARDDTPVSETHVMHVRHAAQRRAAGEPFAYVVGEREFYGQRFLVNRDVLVPRPETEHLVEEALAVLASSKVAAPLVIDVGTGSGAIACTLALESPGARVIGCDVSRAALAVAAENCRRLGSSDRIGLVRGDLLTWLGRPVDLVVANLPYVPAGRIPTLMQEVRDFEPRLALDGGADGLHLVRRLLADATRTVRPGGTVLLELDPEQREAARALLPAASARVVKDLAGLDRVLRLDLP